jgi:two-component system sensor histidine kinase ChiS
VLGVLDIQSDVKNFFTPEDISMIQSIADKAAVAVDRARLYRHLEDALRYQSALTHGYSRFVPPEIMKFLGKGSIVDVNLGDQVQQHMTVLFSDIRDFTTLSEQMSPQDNFNFINGYLNRVGPIIREHNGFIDKYIGDAIMALFSAKVNDAVRAAVASMRAIRDYNETRQRPDRTPIKIGFGLHTGLVMFGTVGESERMEGTVISDVVNLASRLEGLTKLYGASVIISEQILSELGSMVDQYNTRFLDRVRVKGKREHVSIFEVLDGETTQTIELKLKTKVDFETGVRCYSDRAFGQAEKYFWKVLGVDSSDQAARLYLERIKRFNQYGVPVDWQGIEIMGDK